MQNSFIALKIPCATPIHSSLSCQPLSTTDLLFSTVLPFLKWHIVRIIKPFKNGFFHIVMCIYVLSIFFHGLIAHFFIVLNNIPLSGCTTVYLAIQLLQNIWCLHIITTMNKTVVKICVQTFVWI